MTEKNGNKDWIRWVLGIIIITVLPFMVTVIWANDKDSRARDTSIVDSFNHNLKETANKFEVNQKEIAYNLAVNQKEINTQFLLITRQLEHLATQMEYMNNEKKNSD